MFCRASSPIHTWKGTPILSHTLCQYTVLSLEVGMPSTANRVVLHGERRPVLEDADEGGG